MIAAHSFASSLLYRGPLTGETSNGCIAVAVSGAQSNKLTTGCITLTILGSTNVGGVTLLHKPCHNMVLKAGRNQLVLCLGRALFSMLSLLNVLPITSIHQLWLDKFPQHKVCCPRRSVRVRDCPCAVQEQSSSPHPTLGWHGIALWLQLRLENRCLTPLSGYLINHHHYGIKTKLFICQTFRLSG